MGQLRTANKRHNRAVSAAIAAHKARSASAIPIPAEPVEAVS